jgi:midasin (ATPase involved in ribosome maturation)
MLTDENTVINHHSYATATGREQLQHIARRHTRTNVSMLTSCCSPCFSRAAATSHRSARKLYSLGSYVLAP